MKNILICLEKLGIGGIETAVVNQALAMRKLGNNIVVLAKKGIYCERLEEKGIKCIDIAFECDDNIDLEKIGLIEKIIKDYNIDQVHIHQLGCFLSVPIASMTSKIPYIIYLHSERIDPFKWFMEKYMIYSENIIDIFNNAYKIVAITEKSKNNHMEFFKIPEEKYIVRKNSINFEDFKSDKNIIQIDKFLILSRIDDEKRTSIINGIDLFLLYNDLVKSNAKLKIVGDGTIRHEIEEYVKEKNVNNYSIEFLGASNNVDEVIDESDVVIAIGRCILEAIAMKRIAIISGLEHLKLIVTPKNIEKATEGNYIGRYFEDKSNNDICEELIELRDNKEEINKIVKDNYDYIKKDLDVNRNIYYITEDNNKDYIKDEQIINKLLSTIFRLQEALGNKIKEANEIWEAKLYLESQIKQLRNELDNIKLEIDRTKEEVNKKQSRKWWNLFRR